MVQRRGPRLTAAQKAELWRRWRDGESLNAMGRALAPGCARCAGQLASLPRPVRTYVTAGSSLYTSKSLKSIR